MKSIELSDGSPFDPLVLIFANGERRTFTGVVLIDFDPDSTNEEPPSVWDTPTILDRNPQRRKFLIRDGVREE